MWTSRPSVIVDDSYACRAVRRPFEDDPPLIVYSNAVHSLQSASQRLKPIAGRVAQIRQRSSVAQHVELAFDYRTKCCPSDSSGDPSGDEESLSGLVCERSDRHRWNIPL